LLHLSQSKSHTPLISPLLLTNTYSAALNAADKFLASRTKPTTEEGPEDPKRTPRAAIQRSKSVSTPPRPSAPPPRPTQFPPAPIVSRGFSAIQEEDSDDYDNLNTDDEWEKVDIRRDTDSKSGLSVPTSKEDPRYESARRQYNPTGAPENDFVKASKALGTLLGLGGSPKEASIIKPSTYTQRASTSSMGPPAPRQRRSTMEAGVEQFDLAKHGSRLSAHSSDTMKESKSRPVRGISAGSGPKDDRSFLIKPTSKPVRDVPAGSEDVGAYLTKPMSQLGTQIKPEYVLSSGLKDNTVSWRRGRRSTTIADGKAKEENADIEESQKVNTKTKQAAKGDEVARGRPKKRAEPEQDENGGRSHRARSLDSAEWSEAEPDSESETNSEPRKTSKKQPANPRMFAGDVSQYAPRVENNNDDDNKEDGEATKWRIPELNFDNTKKSGNQTKKEKRKVKQSSAQATFETKKTKEKREAKSNSMRSTSKGMSEHKKDYYGLNHPKHEFAYSTAFHQADEDFFKKEEYSFDKLDKLKARATKVKEEEEEN
jgi:hypothetical protein